MRERLQQKISQRSGYRLFRDVVIYPIVMIGLVACSSMPGQQEELVRGEDIAHTKAPAAASPLKSAQDDLLFNLLAGEFAGVRGDLDSAAGYYGQAAELSDSQLVLSRAAYIALFAGNDQQAAALCERWAELGYPHSHAIDRISLMAYLHLQQLEPAVEAIERNLMTDGEVDESTVASMTHMLSKEASPEFALEIAKRLNEKYPERSFLMLFLARFQANLEQYDQALININQLIKQDQSLMDAYLVKAQILAGQNKQEESIDAIARVVEMKPDDTRLRLQFARMLVQFKHFDKAIEHFLVLKESMPDDENVLLSLGLLSIEVSKYADAKNYLQSLLDKGYHNQQAHYYLGRIQQNEGLDMPAIANYERVLGGEYWLDARIRSASLIAQSGDTEKALSRLESLHGKSAKDESNQIKLYLAKGEVLRAASRNREAFSLYNDALNLSPENTDLLYARALTAEKLDLLDIAESDLKMVLMHEPENASALNALGYTLADRTQRYKEAREYILKAARLLPDDPAILDSLGWVHYRLGEYEDAIKWLSKAFEALQDAEIAAHLGEVLWVSGQTEKARNIWKKGQQLDGNQAVLKDTIQRFK